MTPKEHLKQVINDFNDLVSEKYMKGVAEHGGGLWYKRDLIKMAKEEAVDLFVYLDSLDKQIEELEKRGIYLGTREEE